MTVFFIESTYLLFIMGLFLSVLGKGVPSLQSVASLAGDLLREFKGEELNEFKNFHIAILDAFSKLNTMFPGRHYDAPPLNEAKAYFDGEWMQATTEEEKKQLFVAFINKFVKPGQLEYSAVLAGMATPPVAMAAKKAGENLPQWKMLKFVPDVVFVLLITLVALAAAKLKRMKPLPQV